MVCDRIVRLVLGDVGFGNFGILKETVSEKMKRRRSSRGREVNGYARVSVGIQK